MAPWLRDSEGNDVFDDMNSPLSGKPIFDRIDVSRSLGSAFGPGAESAGDVVDDTDNSLRSILSTSPGGAAASSGTALANYAEQLGGTVPSASMQDPLEGDSAGMKAKLVMGAIVVGVALWLLGPLFSLGAAAAGGDS